MLNEHIVKKIESMGAKVKISPVAPNRFNNDSTTLNVLTDKRKGEFFDIHIGSKDEVDVLDVQKDDRHALLTVRTPEEKDEKGRITRAVVNRFLIGHDERHWFVASVRDNVVKVNQAKASLKPAEVHEAERRAGLSDRKRIGRRNNKSTIRQGEWFFVATPEFKPDLKLVLKNEPLRRSGGKSHMMEYAYRNGGEGVMVCSRYPNGIARPNYDKLLKENPLAKNWNWRQMVSGALVFARGRITHPDHATLDLGNVWHRVYVSSETAGRGNVFLD